MGIAESIQAVNRYFTPVISPVGPPRSGFSDTVGAVKNAYGQAVGAYNKAKNVAVKVGNTMSKAPYEVLAPNIYKAPVKSLPSAIQKAPIASTPIPKAATSVYQAAKKGYEAYTKNPAIKTAASMINKIANPAKVMNSKPAIAVALPTPAKMQPVDDMPTRQDYVDAMRSMIKGINPNTKLPVADYAETIYDETQKYPIFKKYPFLGIAQAILESSGFQNYDKAEPKRAIGYAPYVKEYNPQDLKQVIADYASALGGRDAEYEKKNNPDSWQSRMSTSSNYQDFRDTGDLLKLADKYAPMSDNPEHGGSVYADRLAWIMDQYKNELENIHKRRVSKK